ncbi:MAG: neutral/alkaline non-lysosomal ceramidase N-terminal domain-containing protein [Verrucomicrobia bacterium]|nr:neutral/alkaline non-lysosomal ceramidase N-terminal domain-containing protein [Verrucomicrobiota bacterium]
MTNVLSRLTWFVTLALTLDLAAVEPNETRPIGVAKIDITPDYPIRLSGYGNRRKESEGVAQNIFAKALAMGSDKEGPALLITVDNCGVPVSVRDEVVQRLIRKKKINPDRVAICSSHTHSAPCLTGILPNLFSEPIPPEHQVKIDRYTRELIDNLEKVALAALANRKPGKLSWGQGTAGFAKNRRPQGGPVDHDLRILVVTDAKGKLRAVVANYACHCTTVTGEFNQICGDWAGYAQEFLERDHPGAIVLTPVGCGADSNPFPRPGFDLAKQHGQEIATQVNRLLANPLTPIRGQLQCRTKQIELPFDTLPTREQWEQRAKQSGAVGYHAKINLVRLDRGETLPTKLPYLVQTWNFGNNLAMVFLPGEVVVDYSLRLKKEFDTTRLWVNAYANDVPCYIPSRRILKEGGYEGGDAMVYYDRPTKLAMETEDLIIGGVHDLMPKEFLFEDKKAKFPPANR